MILCNREIHAALDSGRLIIQPQPAPRQTTPGQYCPYETHSVDLTLAPEISIPQKGPYTYDLIANGLAQFIGRNSQKVILDTNQPFPLEPNRFVLALTREVVGLPILSEGETCLAARIEGKSSRARCGVLVHFTAPTVHPGWHGQLTLEMINLGPVPFMLRPGMPIAQLIVEEVKGISFANPANSTGRRHRSGSASAPNQTQRATGGITISRHVLSSRTGLI